MYGPGKGLLPTLTLPASLGEKLHQAQEGWGFPIAMCSQLEEIPRQTKLNVGQVPDLHSGSKDTGCVSWDGLGGPFNCSLDLCRPNEVSKLTPSQAGDMSKKMILPRTVKGFA